MVQLGQDTVHSVIPQAAGMARRRHEAAAQGVHLQKGRGFPGIAKVVGKASPGQTGAGSRFDGDEADIVFAFDSAGHERRQKPSQIGTAAGAADDHVRLHAVFIQCRLSLQPDDGLMQQHVV